MTTMHEESHVRVGSKAVTFARGGVAIAFGRYFDQKTKNLKDPYSNLTFCENHPNGQNTETACVLRVPEITKQRVHPWIFDQNQ